MNSKALERALRDCWTVSDLQKRFRKSGMTIHLWRVNRGLPAVVIEGSGRAAIRFIPEEVRAWAEKMEQKMYSPRPPRERVRIRISNQRERIRIAA